MENRGRGLVPDPKWTERNYWDNEISVRILREVQRLAGYEAIKELSGSIRDFEQNVDSGGAPNSFRKQLLGGRITLIPGATGIGKTLLMQSILFTMNKLIGQDRPRVKSVLWLESDRTLRDAVAQEIEDEAYALGLVARAPTVNIASSFSDLLRGPMGAAVTVACPQMLWEKEMKNRSDLEKLRALIQYDTCIFDEVDWASDQVRHIADLMRHALLFSMTASPPALIEGGTKEQADQLQKFVKRFVLISHEAVADHTRAVELDGCLKHLGGVIVAAEHDSHEFIKSGYHGEADTKMSPDHPLYMSAILDAVKHADNDETNMKALVGDDYYSPHVMVAMPSINDIKTMKPNLQAQLERLVAHGHLSNSGWSVSAIYGGHERDSPPDERDLSAKTRTGAWRHPFMIAKNNKGKATDKSKRVLLMCKIGERGINCWPINRFVDNTERRDLARLIQMDLGRPSRWPPHLSQWLGDSRLKDFATAYVYVPSSLYTEDKQKALDESYDFVRNMQTRIAGAGYLTWADLLDGKDGDKDVPSGFDPVAPPLTQVDKYKIQAGIGKALMATGKSPDIEPLIERMFPTYGPRQIKKAVDYGTKLIDSGDFRDVETKASALINEFECSPVSVMEKLKPQDTYSIEALTRFVKSEPYYNGMWNAYIERLRSDPPDAVVVHSVSKHLRNLQQETYRSPSRTRKLHGDRNDPGVLKEVANELAKALYDAGQAPDDRGEVPRAVIRAAKTLFDLHDASDDGPMDQPAYHIAILGRYRRDIQQMARGILISEGKLGGELSSLADWI
jgi:hypothetical protein